MQVWWAAALACCACSGPDSKAPQSACAEDPSSLACMCEQTPQLSVCTCANVPTLPGCQSDPPPCPAKLANGFDLEITDSSPSDVLAGVTEVPTSLTFQLGPGVTDLSRFDLSCLWQIDGELSISSNPDLKSLHGLESVRYLKEGLTVDSNPSLTSLDGLEGVHQIQTEIRLDRNPELADLSALSNVTTGPQQLEVSDDDHLTSLHGLENLHDPLQQGLYLDGALALVDISALAHIPAIAGGLTINSTGLSNLTGLDALTSVGGTLTITSDAQLLDMSALRQVSSVDGDVVLGSLPVASLDGLRSLVSVTGSLELLDLPSVTTLAPLAPLTSVGNDLRVEQLSSLTDATGLQSATDHSGYCSLSYDAMLPTCQAQTVLAGLAATGGCPGGTMNVADLGTCP